MRWFRGLVVVCIVAGIALRARGFFFAPPPLWRDEAAWAEVILKSTWLQPNIRPIAFMAVTRFLVHSFGATELVLRLMPWLAGIGSTLLIVPIARRLVPNRAGQLLLIGAIALHPVAIDFSKEFKPYSGSLFLHLACLHFALCYLDTRRVTALLAACASGLVGICFAQDVIFALPGLYLAVGWLAWRSRAWSHLAIAAAGALATLATLLLFYLLVWRALGVGTGTADTAYWGNKYDVFYLAGKSGEQHWHWLVRKYVAIAAFPGARREQWRAAWPLGRAAVSALSTLYACVWVALHGLGILTLVRQKRWTTLLLLVTPLMTATVFNWFGYWPYGPFRTNLFVLAYSCALAAFGVGWSYRLARSDALPFLVAVALPLCCFERGWHVHKLWAGESTFFDLADALVALQGPEHHGPSELLVLDRASCPVFNYYLSRHPGYGALRETLRDRFSMRCRANIDVLPTAEVEATKRRVWLVLENPHVSETVFEGLDSIKNLVDYRRMRRDGALLLELGPAAQPTVASTSDDGSRQRL